MCINTQSLADWKTRKRAPLLANFQSFNSHKFLCSLAHKLVNLERIYCVVSCELSFANSRENTTSFVIVLVKWNPLVEPEVRCKLFESKFCGDNKSGMWSPRLEAFVSVESRGGPNSTLYPSLISLSLSLYILQFIVLISCSLYLQFLLSLNWKLGKVYLYSIHPTPLELILV